MRRSPSFECCRFIASVFSPVCSETSQLRGVWAHHGRRREADCGSQHSAQGDRGVQLAAVRELRWRQGDTRALTLGVSRLVVQAAHWLRCCLSRSQDEYTALKKQYNNLLVSGVTHIRLISSLKQRTRHDSLCPLGGDNLTPLLGFWFEISNQIEVIWGFVESRMGVKVE